MLNPSPLALRRSLEALRARGETVAVSDLAQRLLALASPVPARLARRIVATALGRSEASLPEALHPGDLRPPEEVPVAGIPLEGAEFSVVDLETTGLSADRCSILEIGAVRVRRLAVAETFQTLVRPPAPVPRAIADLTGIDDWMLRDAPPPPQALAAFRRWLAGAPRAPFVAHNARFDAGFVRRGLRENGLAHHPVPVLCTRQLGRRIAPEIGRYNLDHLCAHFGIRNRARHRAFGDAAATGEALVELLQLARTRMGLETVGDLLDLQARAVGRKRRRKR